MNDLYEYSCLAIAAGWLISCISGAFLPPRPAVISALLVAVTMMGVQFAFPTTAVISAVFSPVSVGVAVFAAADMARAFGYEAPRRHPLELIVALSGYVWFLAASLGVFGVDPYGFGYSGVGPAAVAILLAGYAFLRSDALLGVTIVLAQLAWLSGAGSENLFDHLFGVLLIPALLVGLYRRLRGR